MGLTAHYWYDWGSNRPSQRQFRFLHLSRWRDPPWWTDRRRGTVSKRWSRNSEHLVYRIGHPTRPKGLPRYRLYDWTPFARNSSRKWRMSSNRYHMVAPCWASERWQTLPHLPMSCSLSSRYCHSFHSVTVRPCWCSRFARLMSTHTKWDWRFYQFVPPR